jgi:hypothetical protein
MQPVRRARAISKKGTAMQSQSSPKLVNDVVAADILGVKPITLRKARIIGNGPRFVKLGQCVRYDVDDLAAFVKSRKVISMAEAEKLPGAKRRPLPGNVGRPKKLRRCAGPVGEAL